jgi:uncharacterized phage protein (TIGR02220 family)
MAKDPAFLFYPGDYLRDTQCLSESVQVAYDRIMCEHMRNICISKQQLNFFTKRLASEQKEELLMVLDSIDGGYQIGWVAESIEKRRKYSESRRKNRTSSKKDMNNICKTYDKHMENENENENGNADEIRIIIDFLNLTTGSSYRKSSKKTQKHINARLKEGFTLEDFKNVIEKKQKSWTGTEWEKFLRPETLFGTKFESYLQEKEQNNEQSSLAARLLAKHPKPPGPLGYSDKSDGGLSYRPGFEPTD